MPLFDTAYLCQTVRERQKNDAADAEAICEAALRPSMRFVAVKDEAQQASVSSPGRADTAEDVVHQRSPGHLTEYGYVVAKRPGHVATLIDQIEDPHRQLPESARAVFKVLIARP